MPAATFAWLCRADPSSRPSPVIYNIQFTTGCEGVPRGTGLLTCEGSAKRESESPGQTST
jgi:hypothetical protein